MDSEKDVYFVAVKMFFEKDGKLLILKDSFDDWDLPGGRIKKDEFGVPLEDIIKRKVAEELGEKIKYTIGRPVVFMRHQRIEKAPGNPAVRIFAIGYEGSIDGGEVDLSKRHTEILWVDIETFKPESYFRGGWLKGVQEYLKFKKQSS